MKNDIVLGGKYLILDKILDQRMLVKVYSVQDGIVSYKSAEHKSIYYRKEVYNRRFEDIEVIGEVDVENAKLLNSQPVFSVQTYRIRGVIGRDELIEQADLGFRDLKVDEDTFLISITDPDREDIPQEVKDKFKASYSIKFWDMEESIGRIEPITKEQGEDLRKIIQLWGNGNFLIHCEAGQSRSASVALAVYFLCEHGGTFEEFASSTNPIIEHHRYDPNLFVLETIIPKELFTKKSRY